MRSSWAKAIGIVGLLLGASACAEADDAAEGSGFEVKLAKVYREKPRTPAFALVKDSLGGTAWLATIHGYPDNGSVCAELIEPYNRDPELSTVPGVYRCDEIPNGSSTQN